MSNSPKMQNNNGVGYSYLGTAARKDFSSGQIASTSKIASKREQQDLVKSILTTIRTEILESDIYHRSLDVKQVDLTLMRMASMLTEFKNKFVNEELTEIKEEIIDEINGWSITSILKSLLFTQISSLFDDSATKEDIENLKNDLTELILGSKTTSVDQTENTQSSTDQKQDQESAKQDKKEGDFQDSTIAKNFQTLNNNIQKQLGFLNKSLSKITGFSSFSGFTAFAKKGISRLISGVSTLSTKVGSFTKNTFSKIVNISKVLAGSTFAFMAKALTGIKKGVSKAFSAIKGLGSRIRGAFGGISKLVGKAFGAIKGLGSRFGKMFKGLGSKIGGIGASIGGAIISLFKKIGGWFKSNKEKRAESKKEKLKDRFMNFIMSMLSKLWVFIEPILSKLKIFMLAAMIPIMFILAKVLLIVGAIALVIGAIVLAVWFVKNVAIPKIKSFIKNIGKKAKEFWNKITNFVSNLWDTAKIKAKEIWNNVLSSLNNAWNEVKEVVTDILADIAYIVTMKWLKKMGQFLWDKLIEFGNWINTKYIEPIKNWVSKNIVDPIINFYNEKIKPIIQPFIDSAKDLWKRIKKIFSGWDSNKSIWENLKKLGPILKDSIVEWWNESEFKKSYDTYLKPAIDSLSDLVNRIKKIWNNFKWDENKSFTENLMTFWDALKTEIINWWNESEIKKYWDMVVDYVKDLIKPLKEWYEKSDLKKWIDGVADFGKVIKDSLVSWWEETPLAKAIKDIEEKGFGQWLREQLSDIIQRIEALKKKLSEMTIKVPYVKMDWGKYRLTSPIDSLKDVFDCGMKTIHPFGFLASQPTEGPEIKQPSSSGSIAHQQVQGAMQPINSINGMKKDTSMKLQQNGQEISQRVEADRAAQQAYNDTMGNIGSQTLNEIRQFRNEQRAANKDPAVVPLPVPYGPQRNSAMMTRRKN